MFSLEISRIFFTAHKIYVILTVIQVSVDFNIDALISHSAFSQAETWKARIAPGVHIPAKITCQFGFIFNH